MSPRCFELQDPQSGENGSNRAIRRLKWQIQNDWLGESLESIEVVQRTEVRAYRVPEEGQERERRGDKNGISIRLWEITRANRAQNANPRPHPAQVDLDSRICLHHRVRVSAAMETAQQQGGSGGARRKPVFTEVDQLKPGTSGHTIVAKAIESKTVLHKGRAAASVASRLRPTRIAERRIGDDTGTIIIFTSRNEQGPVLFLHPYHHPQWFPELIASLWSLNCRVSLTEQ